MSHNATIDPQEIKKFEMMADQWWDLNGKFKPLHQLNPVRIGFIVENAVRHFGGTLKDKPLAGLKILDVGCGGGLLCEPLTRLGAQVTGIDASEKNIHIAQVHAKRMGLDIDYRAITAEELLKTEQEFDIVLCMEVVEHVADVALFMSSICQMVKPSGLLYAATINRTAKSFLYAIIGAEYILRWLPRGTHEWDKFLKPSELYEYIERSALRVKTIQGMSYQPLNQAWKLTSDIDINYIMLAQRN